MNELQEKRNKKIKEQWKWNDTKLSCAFKEQKSEQCKDKLTFQSSELPILFVLCLVGHGMRVFLWRIASAVPNEHASEPLHANKLVNNTKIECSHSINSQLSPVASATSSQNPWAQKQTGSMKTKILIN